MNQPFCPADTTSTIEADTNSDRVALSTPNPNTVLCYNSGSVPVFVRAGGSTVTATTADMPIVGGEYRVFNLKDSITSGEFTHIAVITGSSTATIYFTPGSGGGLA